jgi:hypothetical protein
MAKVNLSIDCPECNHNFLVETNMTAEEMIPNVRGNIKPAGDILVYKITSEDIKKFIVDKARKHVSDAKVEVVPRYTEKKRRRNSEPHKSYASLRIAFSNEVVENKDDSGWFGKIGETGSNVRIVKTIFNDIITRYQYNKKDIESWMKNYKTLEELEESFGISEAYLNDIKMYTTPQRILTNNKEQWVIFSAAPENVIRDMLTDKVSKEVIGRIQIQDVYPISKDIVEFLVYVHPNEMKIKENPHVRQILLGEEKAKKN